MKNGIFKDVSVITISKITSALIAFANTALLSRFRTLTEYGTYSQMILAISLVITICNLGLPYAVTYFGSKAENFRDRNHFFSVFYTADTVISALIGVIMLVATPLLSLYFKNDTFGQYWYFLLAYPWIRIIDGTLENALVIAQKTVWIAVYRLIYGAVSCLVVVVIKAMGLGFTEYLIAYTLLLGVLTLVAYALISKAYGRLRISLDVELLKEILRYALPVGLASAVGTINIEFDKLVIGRLCTTEELAIYTNAAKPLPVGLIATAINMVILPLIVKKIAAQRQDESIRLWNRSIKIALDIISTLTLALIVFSPEVMTFIYSEKYVSGSVVFAIYCCSYLLECTYWGTMLNATGNTKYILYSSMISCATNIVLDIVLYRLLGMIGPAIATVTSQFVLEYVQVAFSKKALQVKRIMDMKSMVSVVLRNALIALPFAAVFFWLKTREGIPPVGLAFVVGGVWMVIYALLMGKRIYRDFNTLSCCAETSEG